MPNRIPDCLDGRCLSSELAPHERRLLAKIEAGLRERSRDYMVTRRRRHSVARRNLPPSNHPSIPAGPIAPSKLSSLSAFLEERARRRMKAG